MGALDVLGIEESVVYKALASVAIIWIGVLLSVGCDLWSGIRKAKKRNEDRTSIGLRMTIDKLGKYWNALFAGLAPDLVCFVVGWYQLPFVTAVVALFIIGIEIKSIYEKAEDKKKYKEIAGVAGRIVINSKDKEEVIKLIAKYLENEKENSKGIEE